MNAIPNWQAHTKWGKPEYEMAKRLHEEWAGDSVFMPIFGESLPVSYVGALIKHLAEIYEGNNPDGVLLINEGDKDADKWWDKNDKWQHRFFVPSSTVGKHYTISQHKEHKHWGCSCAGYRNRRECKHLTNLGLPAKEKPFEPEVETTTNAPTQLIKRN